MKKMLSSIIRNSNTVIGGFTADTFISDDPENPSDIVYKTNFYINENGYWVTIPPLNGTNMLLHVSDNSGHRIGCINAKLISNGQGSLGELQVYWIDKDKKIKSNVVPFGSMLSLF